MPTQKSTFDHTSINVLNLKPNVRKRLWDAGIHTIGQLVTELESHTFDEKVPKCGPNTNCRREVIEKLRRYQRSKQSAPKQIETRFFVIGCVLAGVTLLLLVFVPIAEMFGLTMGPGGSATLNVVTALFGGFAAAMFQGRFRIVQRIPKSTVLTYLVPELLLDASAGFAVFAVLFFFSPFKSVETPTGTIKPEVESTQRRTPEPIAAANGGSETERADEILLFIDATADRQLTRKNLGLHFDETLTLDGESIQRSSGTPIRCPVVGIGPRSQASISVETDGSWCDAEIVGLSIGKYEFFLGTPNVIDLDFSAPHTAGISRMGDYMDDGLYVWIRRDGHVLKRAAFSLDSLASQPGSLALMASIRDQRLTFEIRTASTNKHVVVDDASGPTFRDSSRGFWGLFWPSDVRLRTIRVTESTDESLLEQARRLFDAGEYRIAADRFHRIDSKNVAFAEARYKRAYCFEQDDRLDEDLAWGLYALLVDEIQNGSRTPYHYSAWGRLMGKLLKDYRKADDAAQAEQRREPADHGPSIDRMLDIRELLEKVPENDDALSNSLPEKERRWLMSFLGKGGSRWRLAHYQTRDIEELELRLQIEEKFKNDVDPYEIRCSRWRLADAYRMQGDSVGDKKALEILRRLAKEVQPGGVEQIELIGDIIWIHLRSNDAAQGLTELAKHLPDEIGTASDNRWHLLIDRARLYLAQGEKEFAKRDLELFLRLAGEPDAARTAGLDYGRYAEALALLGLILHERQRLDEAKEMWQKGLRRSWGIPLDPDDFKDHRGVRMIQADRALTVNGILMSWTKECTPEEAFDQARCLLVGAYLDQRLITLVRLGVGSEAFHHIALTLYDRPPSRELSERILQRSCSMRHWYIRVMDGLVFAGVDAGAFEPLANRPEGTVPITVKDEVFDAITKLVDSFDYRHNTENRVDGSALEIGDVLSFLSVWSGGPGYDSLRGRVPPEVLPVMQYVFGCRALSTWSFTRNRSTDFFREAYENDEFCPQSIREDIERRDPQVAQAVAK
jgi:tetratricopeptide (TPR) repeat protein